MRVMKTGQYEAAAKVDDFLQNAHTEILKDDNIQAVKSYHSALPSL